MKANRELYVTSYNTFQLKFGFKSVIFSLSDSPGGSFSVAHTADSECILAYYGQCDSLQNCEPVL